MVVCSLLTNREYDVITNMHKTNAEIAEELNISVNTVTSIVQRVFKKYNAKNRADMVIKALRMGLVDIKSFS